MPNWIYPMLYATINIMPIASLIASQGNVFPRTLTESLTLTLRHYENGWRIVSYGDDKRDE